MERRSYASRRTSDGVSTSGAAAPFGRSELALCARAVWCARCSRGPAHFRSADRARRADLQPLAGVRHEQQRLALARAWALEPEVLFLDEPTASLDPNATRAVEQIVSDIHARNTTIVMTTHNLAQAKRLADNIVFLHAGRIAERTSAESFFRSPHSAEAAAYLEGERL